MEFEVGELGGLLVEVFNMNGFGWVADAVVEGG